MSDSLKKVIEYANKHFDGHFTLMKFTGNWRACYGTLQHWTFIDKMPKGPTMEEALEALLLNPVLAEPEPIGDGPIYLD